MTVEQCKQLKHGDILHDTEFNNADGTPQRWRVNGAVKTWKLDPGRVKVPVKRGMYQYGYITEENCHLVEKA